MCCSILESWQLEPFEMKSRWKRKKMVWFLRHRRGDHLVFSLRISMSHGTHSNGDHLVAWLSTHLMENSPQKSVSPPCMRETLHLEGKSEKCAIKFYVSFAKEPYKRHGILQKRPIILARDAAPREKNREVCWHDCQHTWWKKTPKKDRNEIRKGKTKIVSFIGLFCKRDL